MNAQLEKSLSQPVWAAIAVYVAGLTGLLIAAVLTGAGWPGLGRMGAVPWWAWFGGLLGVTYVIAMLLFAGQLDAATFTGVTVAAAIVASLVLDHWGLVGFERHAFSVWRGLGAVLMVAGLGLISRF